MISYWLLVKKLPRFLEFFGVYHHYRILGWAWFIDFYIFIKNLTSEKLRNHKKCRKVKPFDMPLTGYKDWLFIWRRISSLSGVTWCISCSIYSKGTVRSFLINQITEYQSNAKVAKKSLWRRPNTCDHKCEKMVKKHSTVFTENTELRGHFGWFFAYFITWLRLPRLILGHCCSH